MSRHTIPAWLRFSLGLVVGSTVALNAWAGDTQITVLDGNTTVTGSSGATLIFPVTRSGDLSYDAYISYKTQDDTAIAGKDYTGANGFFKIPAGASNADLRIQVAGSAQNYPDKVFSLNVLGASNTPPGISFAPLQSWTVGGQTVNGMAAADLNGDGQPDLVASIYAATTTTKGNTVSVLLNTGTAGSGGASYDTAQSFTVGTGPSSAAAADLNGDGIPDLVVTNQADNTLSVLVNTTPAGAASASFSSQQVFPAGTQPDDIQAIDLNGDGKPDLVWVNIGDDTVSVLLNTTPSGSPTVSFAPVRTFATGSEPVAVAVGDLNGDGKPDVAVANDGSFTVSVLLNTTVTGAGAVSFTARQDYPTGPSPEAIAIADVNGDGVPDVITADGYPNALSVLVNIIPLNSTTDQLQPAINVPMTTHTNGPLNHALAVVDVDGDGAADLVVTDGNDWQVFVFQNTTPQYTSTPTFGPQQTFSTGSYVYSLTTADVDGDGKPDLVMGTDGGFARLLLNTTTLSPNAASFTAKQDFAAGSSPDAVAVADVNGDGLPDIVTANEYPNQLTVLINTTAPGATTSSYAAPVAVPMTTQTQGPLNHSLALADVNGDGLPDIVVTDGNDWQVFVFLNTTAPGASTPSFGPQQDFSTGAYPYSLSVVDVDGDGRPDLLMGIDGGLTALLINATSTGSSTAEFDAPEEFQMGGQTIKGVAAADLNGDSTPDLVATVYAATTTTKGNTISVILNSATPYSGQADYSAPAQSFTVGSGPSSVAVADLNGDWRSDVIVTNQADNTISVLMNTTTPAGSTTATFAPQQVFATGKEPDDIQAIDVNDDGKPDLVWVNIGDNTVSVMLNSTPTGSATVSFAAAQTYPTGTEPVAVAVADLNGDYDPDLVMADDGAGTASVMLSTLSTVAAYPSSVTGTIHYEINTPAVLLQPSSENFGNIAIGRTSQIDQVDVFNDGTGNLVNIGISVAGANAGDFSQWNDCPQSLAPNAHCTVNVTFAPGALGSRSATLVVASNAASSPDSVSLTGTGVGAAATANPGSVTTTAGQAVSGTFSATLGYTGQSLTFYTVPNPGHGTVTVTNASTGAFTYTPNAGYVGTDSFYFYAADSYGTTSNTALETITINDVAATAGNGNVSTSPDTAVNGTLAATSAYSGQSLTYAVVANPAHGTVSVAAGTGAFTYTPANGYAGADSFTFKVTDGAGTASNVATESVTVTDVAATANGSNLTTGAGQAANSTLSATPAYAGQILTYNVVSAATNGTVSITNASTGAYTYSPASGFAGSDSFTFKVTDAAGTASNVAVVSITVSDSAPTAANGGVTTTPDTAVNGTILAGNSYPGQTFTYVIVSPPPHGSVSLNNSLTGSFTYTPATGYAGMDSFTFEATDAYGTVSNTATESVTVTDQAPTASGGNILTSPDLTVNGMLQGGARYTGQNLTFSVTATPSHGTVSITNSATGAFTYTPAQGFAGTDSFSFQVTDQWGSSATATESVTVNDVAPTISGTTVVSMTHNKVYNGSFTATSSYAGQVLSVSVGANPAHGTLSLNAANRTYTYTPVHNYRGSDSFSLQVTDQWGASNTLMVNVTVN